MMPYAFVCLGCGFLISASTVSAWQKDYDSEKPARIGKLSYCIHG